MMPEIVRMPEIVSYTKVFKIAIKSRWLKQPVKG